MSDAPAKPAGGRPPWVIAPVVALAAFMEVLDISIANVALRHIAGNLSATLEESTWILTSYLVTNAIILPVSGWLSSVLGRKRYFLACIVGFGVTSLFCGLAPSLATLIAARALQGLTGGGLQPTSQAILTESFPPSQRGQATALYGLAVVFAPAIGPTLGGWITDNFSWHWVFLVNVPVSIALFFLGQAIIVDPPHVEEQRKTRLKEGFSIDYLGFSLLALGIGSLQLVLDRGQQDDWFTSPFITAMAALSVLALVVFVIWELSRPDPIVDLGLLRNRNFAIANILLFILGFVLLATTALLPQYVQVLLGYTATDAGMVLSPGGLIMMILMPMIGRIAMVVDPRHLIAVGLVACAGSLVLMSGFNLSIDYWSMAIARIVQTIGMSCLFIPINMSAYSGLPPNKIANAAALVNLSRNIGGSAGIAVATTLLSQRSQHHQSRLVEHLNPYAQPYLDMLAGLQQRMMQDGNTAAEAMLRAQAVVSQVLERQSQLMAYLDDFRLLALLCLILAPLAYLMRRPRLDGTLGGAH